MVRGIAPLVAIGVLVLIASGARSASNSLVDASAVALKAGDAIAAEALASKALASGSLAASDHARALLNRGLAREQQGRREEAVVDYTAAIQTRALDATDQARALFDRGVTVDELGHTLDAIGDYSGALKLSPNYPAALNNRANAYRRIGKLEDAKRDYYASLGNRNSEPEYPQYGLGQIAETQNDLAAARDWYNKALSSNANYTLAAQRLAALGGFSAPTVLAATEADQPITLHPPSRDVTSTDTDTIVLHPPANTNAISLHPPKFADNTVNLHPPHANVRAPVIAPADYAPPSDAPDLRPAIDEDFDDKLVTASTDIGSSVQTQQGHDNADQIQLGAWRAEADAANGWNSIVRHADGLLDGMTPQIVMADIPGKGRYFRLRSNPTGVPANDFCAALRTKGIACFAVR